MPVVHATAGGGVKLDPGTYVVECIGTEEDTLENAQFGSGNVCRIKVRFEDETDDGGDLIEMDAIANLKLTPKSKLWGWLEAFGFSPEVGQDVDTDVIIGLKAQAKVIQKEGSDGAMWARIDDFFPLPKSKGGKAAESKAPALINADGSPNWTVFWAEIKRLGGTRQSVAGHVGGDLEVLMKMDGPDVAEVLDEIRKATESPFD